MKCESRGLGTGDVTLKVLPARYCMQHSVSVSVAVSIGIGNPAGTGTGAEPGLWSRSQLSMSELGFGVMATYTLMLMLVTCVEHQVCH